MDWLPSVIWLALLVLFSAAEAATTALVSIWFAAGALCALLCSLVTANIWIQILVFVVVSAIALAVVRPLARKHIFPHRVPTNADRVIGREGVVSQAVDNIAATGAVVIGGMAWSARSETGEPIPEETVVTVQRIEGVKLFVSPTQH